LRALLVVAHPLDNAFAKAAAERIRAMLERRGIEVDMIDLYADDFDPRLTGAERGGYFRRPMIAGPSPAMSPGSGWPRSSFFLLGIFGPAPKVDLNHLPSISLLRRNRRLTSSKARFGGSPMNLGTVLPC
jgi:hypothetical protein